MAPPSSWSMLSLLQRMRALSASRILCVVLAGFLLAAVMGCSGGFFLLVLLALPVAAFFNRVFRAQAQCEITDREVAQLATTYLGGVFPGALLASTVEAVLAPLFAMVCFYDQSDSIYAQLSEFLDNKPAASNGATPAPPHAGRLANVLQKLQIEKTFGFYVFILLSAFVVAGLVEEATKLWVVQARCLCNCSKTGGRGWLCDPRRLLFKRVHHMNHHVVIVLAVTAAALGFATIENVAFTFAAPTFSDRLQSAVLRSVVSLPLHGVCGAITGTRLARALLVGSAATSPPALQWRQNVWVLFPSVLLHGAFDLQIFLVSSFVSASAATAHPFLYDILIPSLLSLGVLAGGAKLSQLQWKELEAATSGKGQYAHLDADQENDDSDEDVDGDGDPVTHKRSGVLLV